MLGLEPRGEAERDDWPVFMTDAPERQKRPTFERAQARLHADGIEFRVEAHGDAHSVYFSDPDGNVIELTMRVRFRAPAR